MEGSLRDWITCILKDVLNVNQDEIDYLTFEGRVLMVASAILDISPQSSLETVCNELSNILKLKLRKNTDLMIIVEALLIIGVSKNSNIPREEIVNVIMTMDSSVQAHLMTAIKNNLNNHSLDTYIISEEEEKVEEIKNEKEIIEHKKSKAKELELESSLSSSSCSSSNCTICQQNLSLVDQYRVDLEAVRIEKYEMEMKYKKEIASQANRLVDGELLVCEKDELISNKESQIIKLQNIIEEFEKKMNKKDGIMKEVQELRDEVDVLRPLAKKTEVAEEKAERLKHKLNELAPLKEQLKTESDSHKETYTKLLEMESENEGLLKCKELMEQYKSQYTEASIKVDDLTLTLEKKELELRNLLTQNSTIEGGRQGYAAQSNLLTSELDMMREKLKETRGRGNSLADGVSEINPVLMKEFNRQKKIIQDLESKLDSTALDKLEKCEKERSDLAAKVQSITEKWNDTKNELTVAEVNILELNAKLEKYTIDLLELRVQNKETCTMAEADVNSHISRFNLKLHQLEQVQQVRMQLYSNGRNALQTQYDAYIEKGKAELKRLHLKIKEATQTNSTITEEKVNLLSELANKNKRNLELEAEVEQEQIKRRRVEREKKFIEKEAIRHKMHNANSDENIDPNSVGDLQTAIAELKNMQKQLDNANEEIAILSNNNSNTNSGSGVKITLKESSSSPSPFGRTSRTSKRLDTQSTNSTSSSILADKKVEQLTRERRELLARNLQESKERQSMSQKLISSQSEIETLKSTVMTLQLDKARLERKYNKLVEG